MCFLLFPSLFFPLFFFPTCFSPTFLFILFFVWGEGGGGWVPRLFSGFRRGVGFLFSTFCRVLFPFQVNQPKYWMPVVSAWKCTGHLRSETPQKIGVEGHVLGHMSRPCESGPALGQQAHGFVTGRPQNDWGNAERLQNVDLWKSFGATSSCSNGFRKPRTWASPTNGFPVGFHLKQPEMHKSLAKTASWSLL